MIFHDKTADDAIFQSGQAALIPKREDMMRTCS